MNTRDVVVRIIQPADQPQPKKVELADAPREKPAHKALRLAGNIITIALLCALGTFAACGLIAFGLAVRDVAVLVGIPLTVGLVTTYAIV
jgi:hypothetical protein